MLNQKIAAIFLEAIHKAHQAGKLGELQNLPTEVPVEQTKNPEHGDKAVSIAMKLTKEAKLPPRTISEAIISELDQKYFQKIDIAGPGFINLTLNWIIFEELISEVSKQSDTYGKATLEDRPDKSFSSVLVEYVSANPTGDLHIGHGRQAVIGSSIANVLEWAGYKVFREFYINDAGAQIEKLGSSAKQAILIEETLLDESKYDEENNYPLSSMREFLKPEIYLREILKLAKEGTVPSTPKADDPKHLVINLEEISIEHYASIAKQIFLDAQQKILAEVKTEFDNWYSESGNLHIKDSQGKNKVDYAAAKLAESGFSYEEDGALWFNAKEFGDERNRVLRKSDGKYTYLAADLAYHQEKLSRGYDKLINLWGADHHGQIPGIKGALQALGEPAERLEVILVQLVSLVKDGEEVKMSKRSGNFVTVRELAEEVGVDAFRYFLVESQANNRMVFDISLATKQDKDNPIYYIQYAHARACSIFRNLTNPQVNQEAIGENESKSSGPIITEAELKTWMDDFKKPGLLISSFTTLKPEELASTKSLLLAIASFPDLIKDAAFTRSPYKIAHYLKSLAAEFHQFYTHNRVIVEDKSLMKARLAVVYATKITLHNGLAVLGLSAPEKM